MRCFKIVQFLTAIASITLLAILSSRYEGYYCDKPLDKIFWAVWGIFIAAILVGCCLGITGSSETDVKIKSFYASVFMTPLSLFFNIWGIMLITQVSECKEDFFDMFKVYTWFSFIVSLLWLILLSFIWVNIMYGHDLQSIVNEWF